MAELERSSGEDGQDSDQEDDQEDGRKRDMEEELELEQRHANEQGFEDEDEAEREERLLQGLDGRMRRGGDENSDDDEIGMGGGTRAFDFSDFSIDEEGGGTGLLDDIGDWRNDTPSLPLFATVWDVLSNWITPASCSLLAGVQIHLQGDARGGRRAQRARAGEGMCGTCRLEDVVFTTASEPQCQVAVMGPTEGSRYEQLVGYLNRHLGTTLQQLGIAGVGRDGAGAVATSDAKRRISQLVSTFCFDRAVQNHTPEIWRALTLAIVQAIRFGGLISADPMGDVLGGGGSGRKKVGGKGGKGVEEGATAMGEEATAAQAMADMRLTTAMTKAGLRAEELSFLLRLFALQEVGTVDGVVNNSGGGAGGAAAAAAWRAEAAAAAARAGVGNGQNSAETQDRDGKLSAKQDGKRVVEVQDVNKDGETKQDENENDKSGSTPSNEDRLAAALAKAGVRPEEVGPDSGWAWESRPPTKGREATATTQEPAE
jgi:hypothetical protein